MAIVNSTPRPIHNNNHLFWFHWKLEHNLNTTYHQLQHYWHSCQTEILCVFVKLWLHHIPEGNHRVRHYNTRQNSSHLILDLWVSETMAELRPLPRVQICFIMSMKLSSTAEKLCIPLVCQQLPSRSHLEHPIQKNLTKVVISQIHSQLV